MSSERGVFHSEARARQLIKFEGIKYGNITPTDIDAMIEYQNMAYIFVEVKHLNKRLDRGQELALQRMVDDAAKVGKIAVAFVLEHDVTDSNNDVYLTECKIRNFYYGGHWLDKHTGKPPKEVFDSFIEYVESTKNKIG